MKQMHLYLLAAVLALVGGGILLYKWQVLDFPIQPGADVEVWTVQARVEYVPKKSANTLTFQLPSTTPGYTIVDERFIARNYSKLEEAKRDGRQVQWSTRRAVGKQALYYQATVVRGSNDMLEDSAPKLGDPPTLDEPYATAAQSLLDGVRERSADVATFAKELVRRMNVEPTSEEVVLLNSLYPEPDQRARFITELLAMRKIPARVVHGIELGDTRTNVPLVPLLQVHNGSAWITINLVTARDGWPDNLFLWSKSDEALLHIDGGPKSEVQISVSRNLADAIATAERRLEVQNADVVRYSLLSLPLQTQSVYRVLLMIPIGAFLMLLLRNIVGIKTFGTFMPVLIAIAFRETQILAGVLLFVTVVGAGLLVRFYMERLRLLLVPRLTSVLIIVVILMAVVSVVSQRLGIEVGLSIALFPMVIMAMTIERMSIAWEERGAGHAVKEGVGTLIVASMAYLVMSWPPLEHLVFVFPETLLILLAVTLLLGRYSGYRLTELFRFRALAREASASTPKEG
ncbi:MAG: inactive transglutaminase family protein [Lysobacteraceae bacterium]